MERKILKNWLPDVAYISSPLTMIQKSKVFSSFLILILIFLVIYYVAFRTNLTRVEVPLDKEVDVSYSSPYICIADKSTCNNEGHYQSKSVQVLKSIYVSVRTARKSHRTRLAPLLVTWMQTISPDQVSAKLK